MCVGYFYSVCLFSVGYSFILAFAPLYYYYYSIRPASIIMPWGVAARGIGKADCVCLCVCVCVCVCSCSLITVELSHPQSRSCLVLPQTQLAIHRREEWVLYKLGMLHSITKLSAEHQDALKLATSVQFGQERKSQSRSNHC